MTQIREIKGRIKSVGNTSKVTHAMELIAATKMRKSQVATLSSRPYNKILEELIKRIANKSINTHPFLRVNDSQTHMIVLVTTDRGLVGGLNLNIFKEVSRLDDRETRYIVIGKKGLQFTSKNKSELIASFIFDEHSPFDLARIITKFVTDEYQNNNAGKVSIAFQEFVSTIKQTPKLTQLLPLYISEDDKEKDDNADLFEPNIDEILKEALPHYVLSKIYQIILDAKASEHSARMVAMKNATEAANDLVDDLTLTYNQARQEAVTTELLDADTARRG